MHFRASLLIFSIILLVVAFQLVNPASANPIEPQIYYYTPTPQPDGRILYTIKAGDTCISISLLNNISEEQLRSLNNLTGDACLFLQPGNQLLLGVVEEQPTPGPSPTPTSILPTPTPFNGTGDICVLLFNDINGNALIDDETTELPLSGGAISINDRANQVSITGETNALEPVCYQELPEGRYTVSIAVPEGYNPTMNTSVSFDLTAGDTTVVNFGAQLSVAAEPLPGETEVDNRSPFLGILGGIVLIAGLAFGVYAIRMQKPR